MGSSGARPCSGARSVCEVPATAWHRALYTETKDSGSQPQLPLGVAPREFSHSLWASFSSKFSGQFLIFEDREEFLPHMNDILTSPTQQWCPESLSLHLPVRLHS